MTPILISALAFAFVALGLAKLWGAAPMRAAFDALRIGRWPRRIIGLVELIFGLALGLSVVIPPLTFFAAAPLLVLVLGAGLVHLLRPPRARAIPAVVLGFGLGAAVVLQPLGLRIAMLPTADALPADLLPAETLATYEVGAFLESVTALEDGSLLIAHTTGAEFTTFDFSRAQGKVLQRDQTGAETPLFALPPGHVAGVSVAGPDGAVYLTVAGETRGIWRHDAAGSTVFARAPDHVSWNGLTLGPDGQLYAADDRGGAIWRIDPTTGDSLRVLADERLAPRRFVALAPGANGIAFRGRELIVTVSDRGTVHAATLSDSRTFGPLRTLAEGVPGDDIAVGPDGTVFVTTHPYNTVVAITPEGTRRIVADATTGATGSTDLALSADGTALYMVTDGGLFAGRAEARGALVRLDLGPGGARPSP